MQIPPSKQVWMQEHTRHDQMFVEGMKQDCIYVPFPGIVDITAMALHCSDVCSTKQKPEKKEAHEYFLLYHLKWHDHFSLYSCNSDPCPSPLHCKSSPSNAYTVTALFAIAALVLSKIECCLVTYGKYQISVVQFMLKESLAWYWNAGVLRSSCWT